MSGRLVTMATDRLGWLARSPWFPLTMSGLSILFTLPALGVGFILDDYYHRTILLERSPLAGLLGRPSEMFRFFRGEPGRTGEMMDVGLIPWWTDPDLKAEFLQAITVLTHRLDYALWPDSAPLMHLHNLLWLGGAVGFATVFYRRMLGATWVAAFAAWLYVLDDARGATAGFIANRNVLIAATFGFAALICHDRWRREGSRAAALIAPFLLAGALFCKEEGIGTCAYLGAYALFLDPRGRARGLLSMAPYLTVVLIWRMLRDSWGYGVWNVGLYIDPLTNPADFAWAAAWRIPILLLGQWSPLPADLSIVMNHWPGSAWLWCGSVAYLGFLLFVFWPLLRSDPVARFWAAGMVLATLHVAATFPMDRLLTFAGLGGAGLLAQFLAFVLEVDNRARMGRIGCVVAMNLAKFLVIVHAVFAPLYLTFRAANPIGPTWIEHRFYVDTPLGPEIEGKTLVIVNAPNPAHACYVRLIREQEGQPFPALVRVLGPATPSVTVRRVDGRTLVIRPKNGFINWGADPIFRAERRPMAVGQRVALTGLVVEVTALTPDGRPAEAAFRFDVPLESPSLVWLCYRRGRFVPFTPPEIGEQITIAFDWTSLLSPWSRVTTP